MQLSECDYVRCAVFRTTRLTDEAFTCPTPRHSTLSQATQILKILHICTTFAHSSEGKPWLLLTNAFSVPEVLEGIVLGLLLRQIILSRAVSRGFKRVIDSSPWIQRALFLQPSTAELLQWHEFSMWALYRSRNDRGDWKTEQDGPAITPVLNPFLST